MRVLSAFTVLLMLDSSHSCVTDLDCSLNGKCTSASRVSSASSSASSERTLSNRTTSAASTTNTCVCTKPWYGPSCATVRFKPVTFPQGYVITNAFYILFQQQPLLAYLGFFFSNCYLRRYTLDINDRWRTLTPCMLLVLLHRQGMAWTLT